MEWTIRTVRMTASIKIQQQNHILIVTLDRPKANAIDSHTSREIYEVFEQFENDNSLEVVSSLVLERNSSPLDGI